jgi:hypothetical protein
LGGGRGIGIDFVLVSEFFDYTHGKGKNMEKTIYYSIVPVLQYFKTKILLADVLFKPREDKNEFLSVSLVNTVSAWNVFAESMITKDFEKFMENLNLLGETDGLDTEEKRLVRNLHNMLSCALRVHGINSYILLEMKIYDLEDDSELKNCEFFHKEIEVSLRHKE